ncbi:hypothetical protein [Enterobacter asburiae]|jgi:hypothetical protein|uniref:Uncharacterized protein n=3 Tax=Enterobacter cloacae complex TaxID=354276 RepID=A0ABU6KMG2_ENTAS|nr:hypothetical protein [Enterobacter asburiae]MBS7116338.1 hypothetical protein [Enterobacter cloacae]EKW1581166.1 hypothetical protein [Enterobacter asburiae]ELW9469132.1 hypothetical protein [Enterobacter asburiae]KOQ93371.1 hypothetical protein ABW49_07470 [Enterobacter asburiae]MCK1016794.1 hypothetical protein [Enterobacter asburiae]
MMELKTECLPAGVLGYKACTYKAKDWDSTKYRNESKNDEEWSGFYVGSTETLTLGYMPDCVDNQGNGTAYLNIVNINTPARIIVCHDERFKSPTQDKSALLKELKEALRRMKIPFADSDLLIPTLARFQFYFKCYNNEDSNDMEIIIPNDLVDNVTLQSYKQQNFINGGEQALINYVK